MSNNMLHRAYSRALDAELKCRGFAVDSERPVNTWFTTSTGTEILIGPDRCDLFVRHTTQNPIVLELKVRKPMNGDKAQLKRYMKGFKMELKQETCGALVYFLGDSHKVDWFEE